MQTREDLAARFPWHADLYQTLTDASAALVAEGDPRAEGMSALVLAEWVGQKLGKIRREAAG